MSANRVKANDFTDYLIVPRIRVQNANAVAGSFTHGFPSITAFTGLMWALERNCRREDLIDSAGGMSFQGVGVIAHRTQELTRGNDYQPRVFHLTRNPLLRTGNSRPTQEEGRMHMEISLIFAVKLGNPISEYDVRDEIAECITDLLQTMRIAGGSVVPSNFPGAAQNARRRAELSGRREYEDKWKANRYRLLPGFALMERADALEEELKRLEKSGYPIGGWASKQSMPTPFDAWLSLCGMHWQAGEEDEKGKVQWTHSRGKGGGFLVPISVGYGAIGLLHKAGDIKGARNRTTPFQAVESLQAIGEWRSPARFGNPRDILWFPEISGEETSRCYRCRNNPEFPEMEPEEEEDPS